MAVPQRIMLVGDLHDPIDRDTGRRPMTDHIEHLPRGHRWNWEGTTWLACGGAVSLDRYGRTAGKTWWPQEAITDEDVAACVCSGPVDIVLAHDVPLGAPLWRHRLQQDEPPWRRDTPWADDLLMRSDDNQRRLRAVLEAAQPRRWYHAHHHDRASDRLGSTLIEGLAGDGLDPGRSLILVGPDGIELQENR